MQWQNYVKVPFFVMRSFEYSKTRGTRKTKILTIENIRCFYNKRELYKVGVNQTFIREATIVTIMFVNKKNGTKED